MGKKHYDKSNPCRGVAHVCQHAEHLLYAAAQALLSEWMSTKIRLELDEDDVEDAPCDPLLLTCASPAQADYDTFNGMKQE